MVELGMAHHHGDPRRFGGRCLVVGGRVTGSAGAYSCLEAAVKWTTPSSFLTVPTRQDLLKM